MSWLLMKHIWLPSSNPRNCGVEGDSPGHRTHEKVCDALEKSSTVSLTLDGWTNGPDRYIAVTSHWIDDQWELSESCLDLISLPGSHDVKRVSDVIIKPIREFKLEGKIVCGTTDGGGSEGPAVDSNGWARLVCVCHTLHQTCMMLIKGLKGLLDKFRNIVTHFNHSATHLHMLIKVQEEEKKKKEKKKEEEEKKKEEAEKKKSEEKRKKSKKYEEEEKGLVWRLMSDCETRWNSVYSMLRRVVNLRTHITKILFIFIMVTGGKR